MIRYVQGVLLFAGAALAGCGILFPKCPGISVMRQYVDHDFYASAQVLTPDERSAGYPEGERLILSWSLPQEWLQNELELRVRILYQNHDQEALSWPIYVYRGTASVDCIGAEYKDRCGFLTYCVELLQEGQVVLSEPHQLWFSWITIGEEAPDLSEAPMG